MTAPPPLHRRIRTRLTRLFHASRALFPLTPAGLLLGALGAWLYFTYAEDEGDFILLGVGLTSMGLVALSLLSTIITATYIKWRVHKSPAGLPESITVGVETETTFRPRRLRLLAVATYRWTWLAPADMQVRLEPAGAAFAEFITPESRGRLTAVRRLFEISDIFGLSRISLAHTWPTTLRIQPVPGRAELSLAIRRATDEGYSHPSGQPLGELVEMRRYAAGDSVRHILWKVFARSRRLMVRARERAIAPRPAMVGFFVAGTDDEPSASTARLFLEEGLLGSDFLFAAEGSPRPTGLVSDAIEQLIDSAAHRATGAESLAPLLRTVDRGRLDNLVVFAPATGGAWVNTLLAATRHLPAPPTVVVTVDGHLPGKRPAAWKRLFQQPPATATPNQNLPELYDSLRRSGASLRIIHRKSGALIDPSAIDAWRSHG